MFTYGYAFGDGPVQVEKLPTLEDALERARLHYRRFHGQQPRWKFIGIDDPQGVTQYDEQAFRDWLRGRQKQKN